jgi:hypothetical protein
MNSPGVKARTKFLDYRVGALGRIGLVSFQVETVVLEKHRRDKSHSFQPPTDHRARD